MQQTLPPHLFPKQLSQSKRACTTMAYAKQADEHDQQQKEVGDKHRYNGRFIVLGVGYTAGALRRNPCRPHLRVDKYSVSEIL